MRRATSVPFATQTTSALLQQNARLARSPGLLACAFGHTAPPTSICRHRQHLHTRTAESGSENIPEWTASAPTPLDSGKRRAALTNFSPEPPIQALEAHANVWHTLALYARRAQSKSITLAKAVEHWLMTFNIPSCSTLEGNNEQ